MDAQELRSKLYHFTGTETWFRHPLNRGFFYTEGVRFFAEHAGGGAYWFLDIVATEVFPLLEREPFLVITLDVHDNALITADDGDGKVVWSRSIDYTDCPAGVWRFYLTNNVLTLPSEY